MTNNRADPRCNACFLTAGLFCHCVAEKHALHIETMACSSFQPLTNVNDSLEHLNLGRCQVDACLFTTLTPRKVITILIQLCTTTTCLPSSIPGCEARSLMQDLCVLDVAVRTMVQIHQMARSYQPQWLRKGVPDRIVSQFNAKSLRLFAHVHGADHHMSGA